ncbi:phosphotransferase [Nonomuraea sp. NBC_01738]|uniref:phosphotransferase enzyme family protein n=1 Tax=Nonomuraea sp. NBC_01738 TaxID=2976003 RepID=UPI002E14152B|nr:phosphotransferase [Nonomuraea sp. NBC_01738]
MEDEVARRAMLRYDLSPEAVVALINISENTTYRVDDPGTGRTAILRVHRPGYHAPDSIRSELAWLTALREDAGISTPKVIPARDGSLVVEGPRDCVMFEYLPGTEPPEHRLVEDFEELGAITARMHEHARRWRRPPGFTRFTWDYDAALGSVARWGRWQDGLGVGPAEREILGRLDTTLRDRLARFGAGPERFGLIHADLRLANLLTDGHGTSVIDFDDCGFGWYLYDLGAAVSFIEHYPQVPEMIDSWTRGYRSVLDLPAVDEQEIWTFVMFRRLLLVAWIGSHSSVDVARELGAGYTRDSCDLAERFLT